jgi:hypothetical protein
MKNKIIKYEALDYLAKNPKVNYTGYGDIKPFIKELYKFGAKKVYLVNEFPNPKYENEFNYFVDTLYIVVGKSISVELAIFLANFAKADKCSYVKQHKAIRLWWD